VGGAVLSNINLTRCFLGAYPRPLARVQRSAVALQNVRLPKGVTPEEEVPPWDHCSFGGCSRKWLSDLDKEE